MPYLLFLKKQQNLKLSSAANYRWRFKGLMSLAFRYQTLILRNIFLTHFEGKIEIFGSKILSKSVHDLIRRISLNI